MKPQFDANQEYQLGKELNHRGHRGHGVIMCLFSVISLCDLRALCGEKIIKQADRALQEISLNGIPKSLLIFWLH